MPTIAPSPTIVYTTDEDIYLFVGPDYTALLPASQQLAQGTDGAFDKDDLWTLTSITTDFLAQLPAIWPVGDGSDSLTTKGYVVWLQKPATRFPAGGMLFGVDSITSTGVKLTRPGLPTGMGQPPSPAGGLTGVTFEVLTFYPQIIKETIDINNNYNIDPTLLSHSVEDIANLRPLNRACLLSVLLNRYTDESRQRSGDYAMKVDQIKSKLAETTAKLTLTWTTSSGTTRQTNWFSTRVGR